MKIKIWSDLHFEHWRRYGKPEIAPQGDEDVLVLAGDIDNATFIRDTLEEIANSRNRNIPVLYVPGNHEYYGTNTSSLNARIDLLCESIPNLVNLNSGKVFHHNGVDFYGGTLWTNFGENHNAELACKDMIGDFRYIDKFSTDSAKRLYYSQIQLIKYNYENRNKNHKQVIVTHFMPAIELVAEQYRHVSNSYMNKYFANDLSSWILDLENTTWVYGHTHTFTDTVIGSTRCVCNPCGYPRENHGFYNTEFCIEV